tara:strand:- start:427 stop:639 length:213 start_codon:yes stop_codon:yes gene_type:complete
MITYVYETIPKKAGDKVERFEWQQSIMEDAFKKHPETGVPVRRVMTDGIGYTSSKGNASQGDCCKSSCGC